MNASVLFFFIVLAFALTVVIIKVNSGNCKASFRIFSNIAVVICLTISILFLPFRDKAPESLYERAVYALNPGKQEPVKENEPKEREFPDFVVYECEDYYIGMDKENHVMEIVPSKERLESTEDGERLGYYDFYGVYELAGHAINVYAARIADDREYVLIMLFDEYYQNDVNKTFGVDEHLFRIYDEDNGYMYGYAYANDDVNDVFNIIEWNNDNVKFEGIYEALTLDKKYFEYAEQADTVQTSGAEKDDSMNILTLLLFVLIVIALSAAIIKVNSSEESGFYTAAANVAVGICLTASIMFLPFGTDSPKTLFGRAVNFFSPDKPATAETLEKPVTAYEPKDDEPEEEMSDFVVYECDDYYIGMDKEEHIMKIVPSEERLKDVLATERLGYYDFSEEYELDGHTLNVYSARLSGDPGFVCIVLFEEYHHGKTNPGFTESDALFRLYDKDNGYMYGFAYVYDDVDSSGYGFCIGNKSIYYDGMYEALKLDKKYFEANE